jgi:hypothetical protein
MGNGSGGTGQGSGGNTGAAGIVATSAGGSTGTGGIEESGGSTGTGGSGTGGSGTGGSGTGGAGTTGGGGSTGTGGSAGSSGKGGSTGIGGSGTGGSAPTFHAGLHDRPGHVLLGQQLPQPGESKGCQLRLAVVRVYGGEESSHAGQRRGFELLPDGQQRLDAPGTKTVDREHRPHQGLDRCRSREQLTRSLGRRYCQRRAPRKPGASRALLGARHLQHRDAVARNGRGRE